MSGRGLLRWVAVLLLCAGPFAWWLVADRSADSGARPAPQDCVFFGELALSGEIRAAPQADARRTEAVRLGFLQAASPGEGAVEGLRLRPVRRIDDLVALIAAEPLLPAPKPSDWEDDGATDFTPHA